MRVKKKSHFTKKWSCSVNKSYHFFIKITVQYFYQKSWNFRGVNSRVLGEKNGQIASCSIVWKMKKRQKIKLQFTTIKSSYFAHKKKFEFYKTSSSSSYYLCCHFHFTIFFSSKGTNYCHCIATSDF